MPNTFRYKPWFLLLMPVYLFVHIAVLYRGLIDYSNVMVELFWLLLGTVVVIGLPFLVLGYKVKSWLIAGLLLFCFYYAGPVKEILQKKFSGSFSFGYIYFLPLLLLITGSFIYFIIRTERKLLRLVFFLNVLWLFFIATDIIEAGIRKLIKTEEKQPVEQLSVERLPAQSTLPDIFYIVFDMYTSGATLSKEFSFENSNIETYLQSKGYKVVPQSQSNFNLTPFSMGSILNFKYPQQTDTTPVYTQPLYFPGFNQVADNRLFPFLEKQGYSIQNLSSFNIRNYPRMHGSYDIWQTATLFSKHNFIKKLYNDLRWHLGGEEAANAFTDEMAAAVYHDSLVALKLLQHQPPRDNKPEFVYAHFFKPHDPYTHDSAGLRKSFNTKFSVEEEKKYYTAQVSYVNQLIQKVNTHLMVPRKRPLVIIIQGDHGFRFGMDPARKQLEFSQFNTMYFSDRNYTAVTDSFSAVNTFRVVLNKYFNQQLPMLPHQSFYLKYKVFN
jgi:hypothetical protein